MRSVTALACGGSILLFASGAGAQIAIDSSSVTLDFTGFTGTGIVPAPAAGQLSSLAWSVVGMSDGDLDFGGNGTSADFGRGSSPGGVTVGGIYAFDTGGGNIALGIQPTDADFTPGSLTARFENALTRPLLSVDVSYTIWVLADEAHSTSFDLAWSLDNVTFTTVPALDFTTFGPIPTTPEWRSYPQTTTLSVRVPPNGYLFLRWSSDDAGGSGGRDEIALDDLTLHVNPACGDGYVEGSEACDDGNQDNTDGCLDTCVLPSCGDGYVEQGVEECDPKPGSALDPACCSLACLFTDGSTCSSGGTCHSGRCVPPVTTGEAGATGAAGENSTNGGAAGEGELAGEGGSGETSGSGHAGTPGHAGSGARPGKGVAGATSAAGGSGGETSGSAMGGSSGTRGASTGGSSNGGAPSDSSATGGAASAGRSSANGGQTSTRASGGASDNGGCACSVPHRTPLNGAPILAGFGLSVLGALRRRARRAPINGGRQTGANTARGS